VKHVLKFMRSHVALFLRLDPLNRYCVSTCAETAYRRVLDTMVEGALLQIPPTYFFIFMVVYSNTPGRQSVDPESCFSINQTNKASSCS